MSAQTGQVLLSTLSKAMCTTCLLGLSRLQRLAETLVWQNLLGACANRQPTLQPWDVSPLEVWNADGTNDASNHAQPPRRRKWVVGATLKMPWFRESVYFCVRPSKNLPVAPTAERTRNDSKNNPPRQIRRMTATIGRGCCRSQAIQSLALAKGCPTLLKRGFASCPGFATTPAVTYRSQEDCCIIVFLRFSMDQSLLTTKLIT